MVDKIMNYDEMVDYVSDNGFGDFLEILQEEYPEYKLYSISTSWYYNSQYICKVKGVYGDLIIGWN